jgi:hypothetical protein
LTWLTSESLSAALGREVHLTIVETTTVVLRRAPRRDGGIDVRVHALFVDAPPDVQEAVKGWIAKPGKQWSRVLRPFVRANRPRSPAPRREARLTPVGKSLDLGCVFDALNRTYFGGALRCAITFSRVVKVRRRRRSLQFGSYDPLRGTIRVHPVLDNPRVPLTFVHFVVYHEMLHAALGIREGPAGRCIHHDAAFRARERAFERYEEAIEWERVNLDLILKLASTPQKGLTPDGTRQGIFAFGSLL